MPWLPRDPTSCHRHQQEFKHSGILRACKQIHMEAESILYSTNEIFVPRCNDGPDGEDDILELYDSFMNTISKQAIESVRSSTMVYRQPEDFDILDHFFYKEVMGTFSKLKTFCMVVDTKAFYSPTDVLRSKHQMSVFRS